MNLCRCVCPCHSLGEEFWSQHFTSRRSTYLLRIWSDKHYNCNLWGKTMNNFQNGSMLKKIIYLLSPHQRRQSWPGSDMLCQWRRFLLNDPCSHKDNTSLDSDSVECGRLWQGSPWKKGGGKKTFFQQCVLVLSECFNTLTRAHSSNLSLYAYFFPTFLVPTCQSTQLLQNKEINDKYNSWYQLSASANRNGHRGRVRPAQPCTDLLAAALSSCDWCWRRKHTHRHTHT